MEKAKLVDDLLVNMEYQAEQSPRSCFVVFSSREAHVEIVIDCIENVFQESGQFQVVRLDQHLKSGDSQYAELTELLASCCFAVVILDGFRPNVLFEYGILRGLHKPCIVLLEDEATVDVPGFFPVATEDLPPKPQVDMDRHFSDVKDRFYLRYNRNKPKQIRSLLQSEHRKLTGQIENEFLHSMFPHKEIIESELKAHLNMVVEVFTKNDHDLQGDEMPAIDLAHSHVSRLAKEHHVALPPRYFSTLARTYAKLNATEKAVTLIDGALLGTSDDATLLSDKAYILRRSGDFAAALSALEAAIKIRPKAEFLWHNKGLTLEKLGEAEKAIHSYKKAIALDSSCAMLHFHYGVALYERDDFHAAADELNEALKLRPEDDVFLVWKARAFHCLGKTDDARKIIETVLASDSTNADAWFVLGRIEKDNAAALQHFRKAVELDPEHGGALCSSAACLSNLGQFQEALDIFAEMHKTCPRHELCPTLISNICTTLGELDRPEDGVAAADKILERHPENPGALQAKACSLARLGEHDSAQEIFAKLVDANPLDSELLYNQACAYALARRYTEAVKALQAAIELDPRWQQSAMHDSDFSSLRRTKAYRTAFSSGRSARNHRTAAKKKASREGKTRPTRASRTTK
ncbi:tetratricopeptide repeat protein [Patescibacteria group bacterium]|nr:tetratricopeptide repeat protein [Patescibacteria group bacterium]